MPPEDPAATHKIPPIDAAAPKAFATATFAYNCFWSSDSQFGSIDGVIRTRVGYTGGVAPNPTSADIKDHTECVQMDFDPSVVSYEKLLSVFWAGHDPTQKKALHYKAAVYYSNEQQRLLAESSAQEIAQKLGQPIFTEVLPLGAFYRAESAEQKHFLRHRAQLWSEIEALYGQDERGLEDSTLAARLNAYSAGCGDLSVLNRELDSYNLSAAGRQYLERIAPYLQVEEPGVCQLPQ